MEFPTTNLYELESRVFTDHWSIPYKREESLGKCLIASTCLARHGKTELMWMKILFFFPTVCANMNLHLCLSVGSVLCLYHLCFLTLF